MPSTSKWVAQTVNEVPFTSRVIRRAKSLILSSHSTEFKRVKSTCSETTSRGLKRQLSCDSISPSDSASQPSKKFKPYSINFSHTQEVELTTDRNLLMSQGSASTLLTESSQNSFFNIRFDFETQEYQEGVQRELRELNDEEMLNRLNNAIVVHVPGGDDDEDVRDYVSDITEKSENIEDDEEEEEQDIDDQPPSLVNQVGRGQPQAINDDEEEDNRNIRYVNDIYALRRKKCKYCPISIKYNSVGALLAHIRDSHNDFYRRYIISLQAGEGLIDEIHLTLPLHASRILMIG